MLQGVVYSDIPYIWDSVKHHIDRSLEYSNGRYDLPSVRKLLDSRAAQLWLDVEDGIQSAGVTEIINYPLKKVCTVLFAGGQNLNNFRTNIRRIEEWAKAQGCDDVDVIGRKGWIKVLDGYKPIHTTLSKSL